jgi:hypothetical protein
MNEKSLNQENNYTPPAYPTLEVPPRSELMTTEYHHNHNFSNSHMHQQSKTTFRLIQIEDRLTSFTVYIVLTWILLILSILGLFKSILFISIIFDSKDIKIDSMFRNFEIFNLLMILGHIVGYFYGIQAYTKQRTQMNKYFEIVLLSLAGVNLVYLIIFFFVPVLFITWCIAAFFLLLNVMLYFQAKELTIVLSEKEVLNCKKNMEMF